MAIKQVADFGLSKEEVYDDRNSCVKGTYGYIDPVYISTNKFTKKSDIYSFGVILFELITAIAPHQNLLEYVNLVSFSSNPTLTYVFSNVTFDSMRLFVKNYSLSRLV